MYWLPLGIEAQKNPYKISAFFYERTKADRQSLPTLDSLVHAVYSDNPAEDYPIIISLKEGSLQEKATSELIEGEFSIRIDYLLPKANDTLHLTTYSNSLRYRRSSNHTTASQQAVQQLVRKSKLYFDRWLAENRNTNPALAKRFTLTFEAVQEAAGPDTTYYHPLRPLCWASFKGSPQGNRFAASIFANFGYTGTDTLIDGHFQVKVKMKVYMLEKQSWVRPDSHNAYSLNHEQRHLQLAYLAAKEFEELVKQDSLTPENYQGRLGYWYIQAYRKMNTLQEAYDNETQHGMNKQAQERWNNWIDEQIERNL